MRDKKTSSNGDIYQQQYQRQMEEYSRMTGDAPDGDVDLELHGIDEAFPGQQQPQGTYHGKKLRFGSGNGIADDDYEDEPEAPRPERRKKKKKKKSSSRSSRSSKRSSSRSSEKPRKRVRERSDDYEEEKPRKKRHPIRTFFKTIFILLLLLAVVFNLMLYRYISKVDIKDKGTRTHTSANNDPMVKNILLIGSDSRSEGANGRTDSIIIMTINHSKKTITLTSLMRDMYVNISGVDSSGNSWDSWDKINAAYVYGGAELLMDTIEYNFDIHLDDYAYVDFYAFVEIVDAIGGVEMKISDAEAEGMRAPMGEQNKILGNPKGTDYLSGGGTLNLNGNQALAYARLRYVGNADFERTDRQKRVITAIIDKVKKSDPLTIDKFLSVTASNITTNMGKGEMYLTAYRLIFSLKYDMKSLRIPAEGDYTYGWHNGGQSTLDVDLDACRALLKKELY